MPRPNNQGQPMPTGTSLRGIGTGKFTDLIEPSGANAIPVVDPQNLSNDEKRRLKAAYIRLNPGRGLTERNIDITSDGRVLITGKRSGDTYKSYLDDVTTNLARPAATAEPTVNGTYEDKLSSTDATITGTGIPGATIKVTLQDNSVQTTRVDRQGNWTINLLKPMRDSQYITGKGKAIEVVQIMNGQESAVVRKTVDLGTFLILENNLSSSNRSGYGKMIAGQKYIELAVPHDALFMSLEANLTQEGKFGSDDNRSQLAITRDSITSAWKVHGGGTFLRKDTAKPDLIKKIEVLPGAQFGYQRIRITTSDEFKIKETGDTVLKYKGKDRPLGPETVPVVAGLRIVPRYNSGQVVPEHRMTSGNATNAAPTIAVTTPSTTLNVDQAISDATIKSMVRVNDLEDDARQTNGTPVQADIVSYSKNGQTVAAIDPSVEGEYTVTLRARDSQDKLSNNTVQVKVAFTLPREEAKTAVKNAANAKNAAIDNNNNLTAEEKAAEKAKVEAAKNTALAGIDQAKTTAARNAAQNKGTSDINAVNPVPVAKPAANAALEQAAVNKINEISQRPDLTREEKQAFMDQVRTARDAAMAKVASAANNQAVTTARDQGLNAVNNLPTPAAKYPEALGHVRQAADAKRQAIRDNANLTAEEQADALRQVDAAQTAAERAINQNHTNATLAKADSDGVKAINDINPQPRSKPAANQALEQVAAAKRQAINNNNQLTDEEKAQAIQQVDQALANAKTQV
ncbi:DUF1542 domain-containing protein, partial [Abiotrophia defectiva]|uniref:DUF1542 domain-containing protein n=1 Tax=Abiotrophia defectiva TaxID=46125 RepID=UPI0026EA9A7C